MIEWNFGLAPLTPRDAAANNLGKCSTSLRHRASSLESAPPFIPLHPARLWCAQSPTIEATDGENPLEAIPDVPLPPPVLPGSADADLAKSPDQFEEPHAELLALANAGFFRSRHERECEAGSGASNAPRDMRSSQKALTACPPQTPTS